jgi:hypothetical protein
LAICPAFNKKTFFLTTCISTLVARCCHKFIEKGCIELRKFNKRKLLNDFEEKLAHLVPFSGPRQWTKYFVSVKGDEPANDC